MGPYLSDVSVISKEADRIVQPLLFGGPRLSHNKHQSKTTNMQYTLAKKQNQIIQPTTFFSEI